MYGKCMVRIVAQSMTKHILLSLRFMCCNYTRLLQTKPLVTKTGTSWKSDALEHD